MDTPLLLLVFNRPHNTRRVFEAVRAARPARLFIAADGPRPDRPGEAQRCAEVRAIVSAVDWPCCVETFFRSENAGLRIAVAEAISWFFSKVEYGIILEDDVLPRPEFFPFCAELLDRYRDTQEVMMIAGTNPAEGKADFGASYSFSGYALIWGWATWKRAWQKYDGELESLGPDSGMSVLSSFHCATRGFRMMWSRNLREVKSGRINTWDYQWVYTLFSNRGACIVPRVNLVENIGFGEDATHTFSLPSWMKRDSSRVLDRPLRHPARIQLDVRLDTAIARDHSGLTTWSEFKFLVRAFLVRIGVLPY